MGSFELEDAVETVFSVYTQNKLKLQEMKDLNENLSQILKANQIPRGNNVNQGGVQ